MAKPRRIPVLLGDDQPVTYFVTFCVKNRQPVLATAETSSAMRTVGQRLHQQGRWQILCWTIMPDHIHVLIQPLAKREEPLGNPIAAMKRWLRIALNAQWDWQPGFFDRLLRSEESVAAKWDYMRANPVRAGLVERAEDWPYQEGLEAEHHE